MRKTAYVVEGYVPNGGTYMAYHVARILHVDFGYDVRIVTAECGGGHEPIPGMFHYDPVFPCVALEGCEDLIREDDVLICNPSFSSLNLGLKVRGRKLMYAQGFTTFSVLDRFFDHYVAVSGFVRGFLAEVYGIAAPVIPAFVRVERKGARSPAIAAAESGAAGTEGTGPCLGGIHRLGCCSGKGASAAASARVSRASRIGALSAHAFRGRGLWVGAFGGHEHGVGCSRL